MVAVFLFEHIRDAAFAGLGVDPDDRLVAAPDVGGVDWNIEHIPGLAGLLALPGFFDGVLMRSAEGREREVAGVGMARMDLHARAAFVNLADGVEPAQIQTRMDAVRVEIQRDSDDIEIAGALSSPSETSRFLVASISIDTDDILRSTRPLCRGVRGLACYTVEVFAVLRRFSSTYPPMPAIRRRLAATWPGSGTAALPMAWR